MESEQRAEIKRRAKETSDFLAAGILAQGGQTAKAQAIVDRQPPTARAAVPTTPSEIDTTKLSNAELESLSDKLIAEEVRRQDEGTMPRSASSSKQAGDIGEEVDDWWDTDEGWPAEDADEDE